MLKACPDTDRYSFLRRRSCIASVLERTKAVRSTSNCKNSNWIMLAATLALSISAWGQGMTQGIMSPPANVRPPGLKNVGIEQHLNEQIPPELTFRDEDGHQV